MKDITSQTPTAVLHSSLVLSFLISDTLNVESREQLQIAPSADIMDRLAPEIMLHVVEEVTNDPSASPQSKKRSLMGLRLNCRGWHDVVSLCHLFSCLELEIWGPHGLKRLWLISQTPGLARLVKQINFHVHVDIAEPGLMPFGTVKLEPPHSGFCAPKLRHERFRKKAEEMSLAGLYTNDMVSLSVIDIFALPCDLDWTSSPEESFERFDSMAKDTVTDNWGLLGGVNPPALAQLTEFMTSILSRFRQLETCHIINPPEDHLF